MIYKNCYMQTIYATESEKPKKCTVRLDETNIHIEYDYAYHGISTSPRHYSLTSVGFPGGKAELELSDDGYTLFGTWTEGQSSGSWLIDLAE
jgi:hypothetical protein